MITWKLTPLFEAFLFFFFFTVVFFKREYAQTLICCAIAGSDCRSGVEPESAFLVFGPQFSSRGLDMA